MNGKWTNISKDHQIWDLPISEGMVRSPSDIGSQQPALLKKQPCGLRLGIIKEICPLISEHGAVALQHAYNRIVPHLYCTPGRGKRPPNQLSAMREADIADLIGRHEVVGKAVDVPAVVLRYYHIVRGRKFS